MLSYRHAFHAGNHADVLKHIVQVQLLRHLARKDKAFWYIDTHAGAGCYALDSGYATKNAEYLGGIARLWERTDLPVTLADYVGMVKSLNPDGTLRLYPGSALLAQKLLRQQDRMHVFEMHPADNLLLHENLNARDRRVKIRATDGFNALKALLPPPSKRALVLIDPPYEDKLDYQRVVSALAAGLRRFATGVYALWYPQLQRVESAQLPVQLKMLPAQHWLHVALHVNGPAATATGMRGSGMFVLNPPWGLHAILQQVMPYLAGQLGQNDQAGFVLEQQGQ